MATWQILPKPHLPPGLLDVAGHPLLAHLLAQRGIASVEQARAFLDPHAYRPAPPSDLPDLDAAAARLQQAINRQELICVWGDFDVDGQTATALLVSALQDLGARAIFYIPNRLTESHGIKIPALEQVLGRGANLLLTCDTGIDAHQAVAVARSAGVDVIITDHHDLPDTLPAARAVVNPRRLPPAHPLGELPGVGVAYKLAEALYRAYGRANRSNALLDLVALGIVADVARQTGDTRYLLQKGLLVLQQTRRAGLQALQEQTRLQAAALTEEHIGFWLAPRLNALGRLGDAGLGVELLTTANMTRARIIALQLEALNDRRKLLVDRVVVQALGQLEDAPALAGYRAIVLAAAGWHPGVLGLAAGRLAEQFGKPAVLLALRPGGQAQGSARSVSGCDIHQALKTQARLLTGFGGHPAAAGLSMPPENIDRFRRGLSDALSDCPSPAEKPLTIDALVDLPQVSEELLAAIRRLAPFGPGNPPVLLGCRGLRVADEAIFGRSGQHKRLVVEDEAGYRQTVVWWGGATERTPQNRFDLAFTLGPDDYRRDNAVLLTWRSAREWQPAPVTAAAEFIDWRGVGRPETQVAGLAGAIVWAEGPAPPNVDPLPRHRLHPAAALVIWTAPPGQDIYRQALARVNPRRIYLVGLPAPFDTLPAFAGQLVGLVKYALARRAGEIGLPELSAALGHRPATARLGLDWLAAQGKLTIHAEEDDLLVVRAARQAPSAGAAAIEAMLAEALAETAAYRRFFREAGLAALKQGVFQGR